MVRDVYRICEVSQAQKALNLGNYGRSILIATTKSRINLEHETTIVLNWLFSLGKSSKSFPEKCMFRVLGSDPEPPFRRRPLFVWRRVQSATSSEICIALGTSTEQTFAKFAGLKSILKAVVPLDDQNRKKQEINEIPLPVVPVFSSYILPGDAATYIPVLSEPKMGTFLVFCACMASY